jgi:hypothetical protein
VYNCNNRYNIPKIRTGIGEDATAEEGDEDDNADLRHPDGSEEGGG